MNKLFERVIVFVVVATSWSITAGRVKANETWDPDRPWEVIDLAIVLDTSGSMESLIDATRFALWELLNDAGRLEPSPTLRVALVSYGHSEYSASSGRVRLDTDFTQDFDRVSQHLFGLTTGKGGAEYVARALDVALGGLTWTPSDEALKIVIVAGNEAADQDPHFELKSVARAAISRGVFVYAVFWGNKHDPRAESWQSMTNSAEGRLDLIDPRSAGTSLSTPFDEELLKLSEAINDTYLPFGEGGRRKKLRMVELDEKARDLGTAAAASRAEVKSGRYYLLGWDLIDAIDAGRVRLYDLDEMDLPEELRGLSFEDRELFIEEMRMKRHELRRRIVELASQRRVYVAAHMEEHGLDDSRTFHTSVWRILRERAAGNGFELTE